MGELRLLRQARPDDAGRLEAAARRRRRHSVWCRGLARDGARPYFAVGSLLKFRREFDQYINLRPARLFDGVPSPLAGREAGDIDFLIVRENTEGEYSSVGGVMFEGTEREFVVQESIFTRHGTERVLKFAFDLAQQRERKHVTVATKSNGISISMPWWDKRAAETAAKYPDITWDKQHIDILCARFVLNPDRFDVVVASNLFGDILSDLGPACTGTIGIAPSGNLNPEGKFRRCSNRCTARRRISRARTSPTRLA